MPVPIDPTGKPQPTSVVDIITQVARELHIPPALALAIASHESGLNPNAVGDNGTSFGLFQLHRGGELGKHSQKWASNPLNNARTALKEVAAVYHQNPHADWGTIAAMAQRPADAKAYAAAINGIAHQASQYSTGVHEYYLGQEVSGNYQTANRLTGGGSAGYNAVQTTHNAGASVSGGGGNSVTIVNQGGGPAGTDTVPHLTQQDFKQGLASAGFSLGLIKSDKELTRIFNKAITTGQWKSESGINKFLNSVQNSAWFRKRSDSQRKYDNLTFSDPSEQQRQVAEAQGAIQHLANQMGVDLTPEQMAELARTSVRNGLSSQEVQNAVTTYWHFDPSKEATGQAAADVASIKAKADAYYVPMTDAQIQSLSSKMLNNTLDEASLNAYMQQQATSRFAHLKPQLDAGLTVADVADSYKKLMADTLEVDPTGIKNDDPTVMKALQMPDGKGGFALMPLWQFSQTLKQDPRWLQTQNATNALMGKAGTMLHAMGLVA